MARGRGRLSRAGRSPLARTCAQAVSVRTADLPEFAYRLAIATRLRVPADGVQEGVRQALDAVVDRMIPRGEALRFRRDHLGDGIPRSP